MDWKKNALKVLEDFVRTSVAVGAAAVAAYYVDPEHVKHLVSSVPDTIQIALVPLISAAAKGLANWLQHRNDG